MRIVNYLLLIIFVWLQYSVWLGKNGVFDFIRNYNINVLYKNVYNLDKMKDRNNQLLLDIQNLLYEDEIIEEYARYYLDMIKSGETFYSIGFDF